MDPSVTRPRLDAAGPQQLVPGPPPLPGSAAADRDLPPSARQSDSNTVLAGVAVFGRRLWQNRWGRRLSVAAAGLALLVALVPIPGRESWFGHWQHHQQAQAHWEATEHESAAEQEPLKWISPMGPARFTNVLLAGPHDFDQETTEQVAAAVARRDDAAAQQLVRDAQSNLQDPSGLLESDPEISSVAPSLTSGMRWEVARGDRRFYHIYLYDSCAQDGDVVELIINGHRFATVPITHAGTTLSIPLASGTSQIAVRGVFDGGGGITVACRTSLGEGFVRVMQKGEEQLLAIVAP